MRTERAVIFLDIDGVLQPFDSQQRFQHDLEALRQWLADEYQDDRYREMESHVLGAVYYDWDKEAVERLRKLCLDVPADIVITSDWRIASPLSRLKAYFRLHDLDQYIAGEIPRITGQTRCEGVTAYLRQHPGIARFVILDDAYVEDFSAAYPEHFVYCRRVFDEDSYRKALHILTGLRE